MQVNHEPALGSPVHSEHHASSHKAQLDYVPHRHTLSRENLAARDGHMTPVRLLCCHRNQVCCCADGRTCTPAFLWQALVLLPVVSTQVHLLHAGESADAQRLCGVSDVPRRHP